MTVKSFTLIKTAPLLGMRHIQVLFLFTCCLLAFQQRINVSVGIVAMTNANSTNPAYPEYALTEQQRSFMLSSIFWGAIFTQLLGGYLSSRYGAKLLLLCSTLGTSLLGICMPAAMDAGGWQLFCTLRLLQGLCQGVMWPCFYSHLAKWCPQAERNRLGGITQTGMDIGTALGFAVSGLLAASSLGWPSMFYVPGCFGLLWSILWLIYGANTPAECTFISLAERKCIQFAQEEQQTSACDGTASTPTTHAPVPWRAICRSVPYLVLVLCKVSQACCYHTLMQQIPGYIHGIFGYDIQLNALLSALPFVFMCATSYVCLITADVLTHAERVPLAVLRKSINTFASWVPACALVALGYVSVANVAGSISCLVVAVAAISAQAIGSSLNHIDLAPNYAGVLFGISNTLMSVVGVVSPIGVSLVVTDERDRTQWRVVFITIAIILFIGNLLYILFGQMVAQPWNEVSATATPTTKEQKPKPTGGAAKTEKPKEMQSTTEKYKMVYA